MPENRPTNRAAGATCWPTTTRRRSITYPSRALGRRLRRNYIWILGLQALAYFGKIAVHPTPAAGWTDIAQRAAVGPMSGELALSAGGVYYGWWISFALVTLWLDRQRHGERRKADAMG